MPKRKAKKEIQIEKIKKVKKSMPPAFSYIIFPLLAIALILIGLSFVIPTEKLIPIASSRGILLHVEEKADNIVLNISTIELFNTTGYGIVYNMKESTGKVEIVIKGVRLSGNITKQPTSAKLSVRIMQKNFMLSLRLNNFEDIYEVRGKSVEPGYGDFSFTSGQINEDLINMMLDACNKIIMPNIKASCLARK